MKKILVAEDTESNYLLLSIILRKEYEVHRAHDGQEAIEKFESCRPDMILMDIKMPVMDGLEATRRIRLKGGTLPIIALTANAYDSDRDKAFEAGCDDYMAKPIMAPALLWIRSPLLKVTFKVSSFTVSKYAIIGPLGNFIFPFLQGGSNYIKYVRHIAYTGPPNHPRCRYPQD